MSLAESRYKQFPFFNKVAVVDPKKPNENLRLKVI